MKINRGKINNIAGDRKIIFCEGTHNSIDIVFYKNILGIDARKFEFKPLGSSSNLLNYGRMNLIENGFCIIDRDFRTDEEIKELESKYKIKFLRVHELENFLLNVTYLYKLDYIKQNININDIVNDIIQENKNRLFADYLQYKINNYLNGTDYKFPRIVGLKNNEIVNINEDEIIKKLLKKLEKNSSKIEIKIKDIKEKLISQWKNEFKLLPVELLPGKEIFKKIKNKIFTISINESDIANDIAKLMSKDNYLPNELKNIFTHSKL